MLSNAPVALRCTRISFDLARRIRGPNAPDRAILALFSSWVARLVIQPTALHCTSTLGDIIWRIRGASPPRATIKTLFSAEVWGSAIKEENVDPQTREPPLTIDREIAQRGTGSSLDFYIRALEQEQDGFEGVPIDFAHIYRFRVRFGIVVGVPSSSTHLVR